jgi:hypothetical protein
MAVAPHTSVPVSASDNIARPCITSLNGITKSPKLSRCQLAHRHRREHERAGCLAQLNREHKKARSTSHTCPFLPHTNDLARSRSHPAFRERERHCQVTPDCLPDLPRLLCMLPSEISPHDFIPFHFKFLRHLKPLTNRNPALSSRRTCGGSKCSG